MTPMTYKIMERSDRDIISEAKHRARACFSYQASMCQYDSIFHFIHTIN